MHDTPVTFALYFGNRGFFPESLIAGARQELGATLKQAGYGVLLMEEGDTRFGAVESVDDGMKYAEFLKRNRGRFDGVILCLPNFGDETGAVAALEDAGVPVLIHAYPDENDKMGTALRRDAFCGKFSVMDVFYQYDIPFTVFKPHAVHPQDTAFSRNINDFAAVCRIVRGMKRMTVGAIGARTTAFKTVRFDELTLQRYGITTETLDLSDVFARTRDVNTGSALFKAKSERLRNYTCWKGMPDSNFENMIRLAVVLDAIVAEYKLDALALRCWIEIERELHVSPCVLLGEMNDRGIAAACELDVCNAVCMRALALGACRASTCLDWNNNYGSEENKCILFHCGPVPQSLMTGPGQIVDHPMFAKVLGAGCGFGCNTGRIAPSPITFASSKTEDGQFMLYAGEGRITGDPIANDFFGCAGVAEIADLQDKLLWIGRNGFRHHVSVAPGHSLAALEEAAQTYLGYEIEIL